MQRYKILLEERRFRLLFMFMKQQNIVLLQPEKNHFLLMKVTRLLPLFIILAVIVLGELWFFTFVQPKMMARRNAVPVKVYLSMSGIDVSHHQGNIDWHKLSQNKKIRFVYMKATQGSTLVDECYHLNFRLARAAGFKVGSYHYFSPKSSLKEQFDNFTRNAQKEMQDLRPLIDIEDPGLLRWPKAAFRKHLTEFLKMVEHHYGVKPIIYSTEPFYRLLLKDDFKDYYPFIARYRKDAPTALLQGRRGLWQYSEEGHLDGIEREVDLDAFCNGGSLADLLMPHP